MPYIYWIEQRTKIESFRYDKKRNKWHVTEHGHIHVRFRSDSYNCRNGWPTKEEAIRQEIKEIRESIDNDHITLRKLKIMLSKIQKSCSATN